MRACLDVDYRADGPAFAACLLFDRDDAPVEAARFVERVDAVAPYEPGAFYRRELPCLLAVLARAGVPIDTAFVDGYVWLDDRDTPGLGAHLYEALGRRTAVIGVAKTAFRGAGAAIEVVRGAGHKPLYVTAAGTDAATAAARVAAMHGPFRMPTLLRRVDRCCRSAR